MNFIDRTKAPSDSEGYKTHEDATAHGMCEDTEFKGVSVSQWAEGTGVVNDKIREALAALDKALHHSEDFAKTVGLANFKIDCSWSSILPALAEYYCSADLAFSKKLGGLIFESGVAQRELGHLAGSNKGAHE